MAEFALSSHLYQLSAAFFDLKNPLLGKNA